MDSAAAVRRTDALDDLAASAPGRVRALQLDVTDTDRIRVDVLVNNAGRGAIGAAEETSDRAGHPLGCAAAGQRPPRRLTIADAMSR